MMMKEQTTTKKAASDEYLIYARSILKDTLFFRSLADKKIDQLIALSHVSYAGKREFIIR
jgi:hypothetical protein